MSIIQKALNSFFFGSAVLKQSDDQRACRINMTQPETYVCSTEHGSFKGKNEPPRMAFRILILKAALSCYSVRCWSLFLQMF